MGPASSICHMDMYTMFVYFTMFSGDEYVMRFSNMVYFLLSILRLQQPFGANTIISVNYQQHRCFCLEEIKRVYQAEVASMDLGYDSQVYNLNISIDKINRSIYDIYFKY